MRNFRIHFSLKHVISFGYDGLVVTRNKDFELAAIVMLHNRMEGGISRARVVPSGEYIISLGKNNVLISTQLKNAKNVCGEEMKIDEEFEIKLDLMFGHRTGGFLPTGIVVPYIINTWKFPLSLFKLLIVPNSNRNLIKLSRCSHNCQYSSLVFIPHLFLKSSSSFWINFLQISTS